MPLLENTSLKLLTPMVFAKGMGHPHRQAQFNEKCAGRGGSQNIRHPAPYVVRRQRLPVGTIRGRSGSLTPDYTDQQNTAERLSRSPAGRGMARVITGLQREHIAPRLRPRDGPATSSRTSS